MKKKVIVTTSINHPTKAIERFDGLKDWTLIVVGDLKTPKNYNLQNGIYISPEEQEKYNQKLSDLIGWNCIQRRNFGFLWAKDLEADIVATVDDDNIPYDDWGKDLLVGTDHQVNFFKTSLSCFDPISVTNHSNLWHRGFPLSLVSTRSSEASKENLNFHIQADFWNGDPDVDAICRLEHNPECSFEESCFPFASNKISPFNSQNTFITKEVLPHYFMLPHVGRMDDIWASYHVQSLGYKVVYNKPTVHQDRNKQSLTKNLKDEAFGHDNTLKLVESINDNTYKKENFWPQKTCEAFNEYQKCFQTK